MSAIFDIFAKWSVQRYEQLSLLVQAALKQQL